MAEIWLAVERGYLPVRIVLVEKDGTRYEHMARRIASRESSRARCWRTPAARARQVLRVQRARRPAAVALFPRAPQARPARARVRRRDACSRCCGAGARSRPRRARRSRARWSRAALLRVLGFSARALQGLVDDDLLARVRSTERRRRCRPRCAPICPTGSGSGWSRSTARRRRCASRKACSIPRRSICASISRAPGAKRRRAGSARDGIECTADAVFAGGAAPRRQARRSTAMRCSREGLVEVQDEGSQLLAWLLAPRRGEMIADYCAGAGGKTLAAAMLMRGTGRVYAMDVSAKRLAALAPRAARAGITNVHDAGARRGRRARPPARRQARPRAGRRAVQRLRHAAAQSRPEMAPRSAAIDELAAKQRAHPRRRGARW